MPRVFVPAGAVSGRRIRIRDPLSLHQLRGAAELSVLIGPEGDCWPQETAAARQAGARLARLAGLTLRSEIAAPAALAVLCDALDSTPAA